MQREGGQRTGSRKSKISGVFGGGGDPEFFYDIYCCSSDGSCIQGCH